MSIVVYIAVMALTTYLIRMIPFTAFRKKIRSRFFRSLLYYVPYADDDGIGGTGFGVDAGRDVVGARLEGLPAELDGHRRSDEAPVLVSH